MLTCQFLLRTSVKNGSVCYDIERAECSTGYKTDWECRQGRSFFVVKTIMLKFEEVLFFCWNVSISQRSIRSLLLSSLHRRTSASRHRNLRSWHCWLAPPSSVFSHLVARTRCHCCAALHQILTSCRNLLWPISSNTLSVLVFCHQTKKARCISE